MFTETRYRKHTAGMHIWELHIQTPHEKYLAMNHIPKTVIKKKALMNWNTQIVKNIHSVYN